MKKKICLSLLLGLLVVTPALAAPQWLTEPVIQTVKKLPKGTPLKTYTSPNKKMKLVVLDEQNQGDFFYYSYYFYDGQSYSLIQTYIAEDPLPKTVTWFKDHVQFQALSPIDNETVQRLHVEYYFAKKQVKFKVLKTEQMKAAG